MGKLNIVVKEAPAKANRESKYLELYVEIAQAFENLSIGQCFEINSEDVPASSLTAKIKSFIKFKDGEDLRLSRLTKEENGSEKVYAVRLTKIAKSAKPTAEATADIQGKTEDFN